MARVDPISAVFSAPPGVDAAPDHVIAAGPGAVVLPYGDLLLQADYLRVGHDLQLTSPDGTSVLVTGYFSAEHPPDLFTLAGARIKADLAAKLAGPQAPGQTAQAGPSTLDEPIGSIEAIDGIVIAVRADGVRVVLSDGDPVYQGDTLISEAGGAAGIVFADQSTMSMGGNARIVLDEMVYDAGSGSGSQFFNVVQGAFVFTSGAIGRQDPDNVTVQTPVATIGIRGTKYGVDVDAADGATSVTVFEGAVVVSNSAGTVLLSSIGESSLISSLSVSPSPPFLMPADVQERTYGEAIRAHPPPQRIRAPDGDEASIDDLAEELAAIATAAGPMAAAPTADGIDQRFLDAANQGLGQSGSQGDPAPVNGDGGGPPPSGASGGAPTTGGGGGTTPALAEAGSAGQQPAEELAPIEESTLPDPAPEPEDSEAPPLSDEPNESGTSDDPEDPVEPELPAEPDPPGETEIPPEPDDSPDVDDPETPIRTVGGLPLIETQDLGVEIGADGQPILLRGLESGVIGGVLGTDALERLVLSALNTEGAEGERWRIGQDDEGNVLLVGPDGTTLAIAEIEQLALALGEADHIVEVGNLSATGIADGAIVIETGDGDDVVLVAPDEDVDRGIHVYGGAGDDTLMGGNRDDVLYGGEGDDLLIGGAGDDTLIGGDGDDTLIGGPGSNFVDGGEGSDTAIFEVGLSDGQSFYDGGPGVDALIVRYTETDLVDAAVRADLMTLRQLALDLANGENRADETVILPAVGLTLTRWDIIDLDGPPLTPTANLSVAGASGLEDHAIPIEIQASLDEPVPGVTLSVRIAGLPPGAVLTNAAGDVFCDAFAHTLTPEQLAGLALTPPANSATDIDLSVTAEVTDEVTALTRITGPLVATVVIAPVADTPLLSVVSLTEAVLPPPDFAVDADMVTARLDVHAALVDTDGSEVLLLSLSGIPAGALLWNTTGAVAVDDNGVANLQLDDLDGLSLSVPPSHPDFSLTVTARSIDFDPETGASDLSPIQALRIDVTVPEPAPAPEGMGGNLIGTPGDDLLIGDDNSQVLVGGPGDDTLIGGAGADLLIGGPGDDTLVAGSGADMLIGGPGDDVLIVDASYLRGADGGDAQDGPGRFGIDGGPGNDVLRVISQGGSAVSLSGADLAAVRNVETIDLTGIDGQTSLTLSVEDLISFADPIEELTIRARADTEITIGDTDVSQPDTYTFSDGEREIQVVIEQPPPESIA